MSAVFGGAAAAFVVGVGNAHALDMDSFMNSQVRSQRSRDLPVARRALRRRRSVASGPFPLTLIPTILPFVSFFLLPLQLEADTKNCDPKKDPKCAPQMTEDEALCKYGQSGDARAEACKRFKAGGGTPPKPGSGGKSLGGAYAM